MNKFYYSRLFLFYVFIFFTTLSMGQSFNSSGLIGESISNPTSLQFGPNGKLYVSQQDGTLWEFTVVRDDAAAGSGSYTATSAVEIDDIKTGVPNHNDDGSISTLSTRQVTGLYTAGTSAIPVLYVSSSDSRIGGSSVGTDTNLDTNSGVLSRLTWNGIGWDRVDLVRGLPRCEENHSSNGMDIFENGGSTYMLLQQGGNTNEGGPSNNFAGTSETYLSGALLIINLTQLEGMTIYTDSRSATSYVYDLPTLNDPTRADITNADSNFPYTSGHPLYNATIDVGDPFGGNDSRNQSFSEAGAPVQIFSPGYRNAYDVVVTDDGRIFTGDNGSNDEWGGPPVIRTSTGALKGDQSTTTYSPTTGDYVTNEFNVSLGATDVEDGLHYVGTINDANNTYYAGHPVPIRAFPSRAEVRAYAFDSDVLVSDWVLEDSYDWASLIVGVSGYFNTSFTIADFPDDTRQGEFLAGEIGSADVNILDLVNSSTNGMCEYTATNFSSAMVGDLLTASFNGSINRYELDASGTGLLEKNNSFLSGFGSTPLDVIAQGDSDVFPGTIWSVTYGANNITIFEPADFGTCLQPGETGYDESEDSDLDGYTNGDEILNGTDHCNGGSKPNDNDLDFISDLSDPDDDNDGILDVNDVFAIDADNGTTTDLPINYPFWNNDPGTGFGGIGFTGWMINGSTDYLDQYDESNLSFGGAGGKATISLVPEGDALDADNSQQNGFQFGVNVDVNSPIFTIHAEIESPFGGVDPVNSQSYGIFLGNGDQDNYMKVVLMDGVTDSDGISGFEVLLENGGTSVSNTFDAPNLIAANAVDIYISVDPAANTAQPFYSLNSGITIIQIGSAITLPTSFLDATDNTGMAVGIISTSDGVGTEFNATWDFINVTEDGLSEISIDPNPLDFGTLGLGSEVVQIVASAFNTGGPSSGAVQITDITINGTDASLFSTSTITPVSIGPGSSEGITINFTPNTIAGTKTANLVITHSGANSPLTLVLNADLSETTVISRINAGGQEVIATDDNMNWEFNADTGAYSGTTYSVTNGLTFDSNLTYANRHVSIPSSIDEATFDELFAQERYNSNGATEMNFSVPVTNGTYTVNIFMGNSFSETSELGERVFDIALEGITLRDDLDLISEFGHESGGMITLQTDVIDGVLNIVFSEEVQSPLVNAIEVIAGGTDFTSIVLQTIEDVDNFEGDSGTFLSVGATGGDDLESFTYSISGQPSGVTIEETNGQVIGTIAAGANTGGPNGNGVYTVTVTAAKLGSNPDSETFTWSIFSDLWVDKNEDETYTARHECSFVQAGDKFFLMGGRENAKTVDVYDYASDSWVSLVDSAPNEFNHFQATEYQGLIWVIGAFADNGFPNEVPEEFIWAFDPSNNEWIQGPEIPVARRRGSTGLVVQDDKFYIIGGNTDGHDGGYVAWFDEYDPATGVWTALADAPRSRDHFSAAVIDDNLYLAGGRLSGGTDGFYAPTISEVDVYDFVAGTWSTLPTAQNIPTARGGASTVAYNGKLLVIGGEVENQDVYGANTTGALDVTEEYDPSSAAWTRVADLNNARHGTQAIVSGDGVFTLGGSNTLGSASGSILKDMEYLGIDNPVGDPSTTSTLSALETVLFADGTTEDIALDVIDGNVGILVTSMEITGDDAADYTITSGELTNQLLNVDATHTISVALSATTGLNRTATLTIYYRNGESVVIELTNYDINLNVTNPGTQNNNENDVVSLQIDANGASAYSATGLPPTLTIDTATGLISGTVTAAGVDDGAFIEEDGLVIIEAESGVVDPTWAETTIDGATGLIAGTDHFGNQNGGTIPYDITVSTPGVYRFDWRNFYSGTNQTLENDNWLKFPNDDDVWFFGLKGTEPAESVIIANVTSAVPTDIVFPIGSGRGTTTNVPDGNGGNGYFKIYRSGGSSETYDWSTFTSDNDPHNIYVYFVNAGTYTMQISERSAGHAIDKIALHKVDDTSYTDAQLTALSESPRESGGGAADGSPYTVTVTVLDDETPVTTTSTQFIWNIGEAGDPIAIASADPTSGFAPLDVNFTGNTSSDDGGIVSYLWDFGDGSPTTNTVDPSYTFTEIGTYTVQLTVEDANGTTNTTDLIINVTDPSGAGTIRINSGGPTYTFDGVDWSLDQHFIGGEDFDNIISIANTSNDELYQTERFNEAGTLTYEIPVVSGDYNVNLHFAELFYGLEGLGSTGGEGSRIFNINVEDGQVLIDDYDIFVAAGGAGTAIIEDFSGIIVNDGFLTVTLTGVVENPKLSGIEIIIPGGDSLPVAYAGEDQTITLASTALDGSATDADGGGITSYAWEQVSGPSTAIFSTTTSDDTVVSDLVSGSYVFRITATDEEGDIGSDEVTITINGEPGSLLINAGGPNVIFELEEWTADDYFVGGITYEEVTPIANTTNDEIYQTERYNTSGTLVYEIPLALAGDYNVDLHFAELFYGFEQNGGGVGSRVFNIDIENGQVQIDDYDIFVSAGDAATAIIESFKAINVSDGSLTITLTAVVENPKISAIAVFDTAVATVDAGLDQTIDLPTNTVTINGSATDPDGGEIVSYLWTQVSGPASSATLTGETTETLVATDLQEGDYVFKLTATDDEGTTGSDEVTITVVPVVGNDAPVAIASGTPLTGTAPLIVAFTGSNSTDDVAITSYFWDFQDGNTSTDADPSNTFTVVGSYDVLLTVTDAGGLTNTAIVTIVVDSGDNDEPIARAEADVLIGMAPLTVMFTGSNSTADVVSYLWDFQDGNTSTEADPDHIFVTEGTFDVLLTVTDAEGLTDTDTITIVINSATDQGPTAIIIADPTRGDAGLVVTFDGSTSDDNTGVTSYLWDFGDGTVGSTEAIVEHTYDTIGVYTATLTVEDEDGLTSTDTVSIIVIGENPIAVAEFEIISGVLVGFTGSNSAANMGGLTYSWDLGDGRDLSSEADFEYLYELSGSYTVTLTVTDENGLTGTDMIEVIVEREGLAVEVRFAVNPPDRNSTTANLIFDNLPEDVYATYVTVHDIGGRYVDGYALPDQISSPILNEYDISIANLQTGMYLVRVILSNDETKLIKLLISN